MVLGDRTCAPSEPAPELDRIAHHWQAHHDGSPRERPAYLAALQAAHTAMRKLGTASEVARFLWEGRRRTDWPALRALCIRISTVLTLRTDVDPDLPLLVCHQPGSENGHGPGGMIPEDATCAPDGVRAQPADRIDTLDKLRQLGTRLAEAVDERRIALATGSAIAHAHGELSRLDALITQRLRTWDTERSACIGSSVSAGSSRTPSRIPGADRAGRSAGRDHALGRRHAGDGV